MSYTSAIKNPGPGSYNVEPTINLKGRYTLSRFANSGANIISPTTSKRFGPRPYGIYYNPFIIFKETIAPGPGQYHPKNDL